MVDSEGEPWANRDYYAENTVDFMISFISSFIEENNKI